MSTSARFPHEGRLAGFDVADTLGIPGMIAAHRLFAVAPRHSGMDAKVVFRWNS